MSGKGTITERYFTLVVEQDPESGWLVGEVVELPGCYTQAPDLPTLEANAREAIVAYLKTAAEQNETYFSGVIAPSSIILTRRTRGSTRMVTSSLWPGVRVTSCSGVSR